MCQFCQKSIARVNQPTKMGQYVVQYVITGVAKYGNLHLHKCVNNPDLS